MGFSLKSIGKGLTNVGKYLFGRPGGENPFSPPDLQALIKNNPYAGLSGKFRSSGSFLDNTDSQFNDLLTAIGGQNEADNAVMQELLAGINTDTDQAQGSLISDMAERGLVGPGQSSDIYSVAAAQTAGEGARRKAQVRSDFARGVADRIAGAYGDKYKSAVTGAESRALSDANIFNQLLQEEVSGTGNRDISIAQIMSGLYGTGEANKKPRSRGLIPALTERAGVSFADSLGKGAAAALF